MKQSVLIVDDDQDSCKALAAALRDQAIGTVCVGSGRDALEKLHHEAPSVLLLDASLGGDIDWGTLLRLKAADQAIAAMPVIMMSGDDHLPTTLDGVVAVLRKPFKLAQLLRALDAAIERPRSTRRGARC